jgi:hypothetical protein
MGESKLHGYLQVDILQDRNSKLDVKMKSAIFQILH